MQADLVRRARVVRLLSKYMPVKTAWDMEAAIFQKVTTSEIVADYEAKARQLAWNVAETPALLTWYTPNALVHLDDTTLSEGTAVEAWWVQYKAEMLRHHVLLHEEHRTPGAEGSLACNRCHSRDVSVNQQQTRSADEGMTVFCTCVACGLRWKL